MKCFFSLSLIDQHEQEMALAPPLHFMSRNALEHNNQQLPAGFFF